MSNSKYSLQQKQEALEYVKKFPELPIAHIAQTLNMPSCTLNTWTLSAGIRDPRSDKKPIRTTNYSLKKIAEAINYRKKHPYEPMKDIATRFSVPIGVIYYWLAPAQQEQWEAKIKAFNLVNSGLSQGAASIITNKASTAPPATQIAASTPLPVERVRVCEQCEYLRKQLDNLKQEQAAQLEQAKYNHEKEMQGIVVTSAQLREELATYRKMLKQVL